MRISTVLRVAAVPAIVFSLAACSDGTDARPAVETTQSTDVTGNQGTATETEPATSTEDSTTQAEDSTAQAEDPTSASAQGVGDVYATWGARTECPSLEEMNAATGLTFLSEEGSYEPSLKSLGCVYGDPQDISAPVASIRVQVGEDVPPVAEPSLTDLVGEGVDGGVIPAAAYGPNTWYIHAQEDPAIGSPSMCMIGGAGTDASGVPTNVMFLVGDNTAADSASLCDRADAIAALG